ncbi:C-type lectin domain-containing protein [Caenorhabditis elegans]|uniref:C-type lectin domain-containing protein n=1 Tax=Caenorhabditis elegans TaxID=6239 RepID=Q20665_CAEEL|nr:C-type lectin domain-containing protein [Caenorhabditis elegans]CCD70803.1 C-type lectin domain-containing protein [Caenorhabditis elegans]|eukprot:NP_505170.2 Uncharacterized protein CELE_F52E1.2 [Caenorhabditis elegans]
MPTSLAFLIVLLVSTVNSLDLNDIKKIKTNPTTISTTTLLTTTTPEYVTFTIVDPGAMLIDCPGGCPTGWQYLNSKCYKKFDAAVTYAGATSACAAQGAELVTIDSFDENDALRKAFDTNALVDETKETWIGLKSLSGAWQWADGSSATYTNWAPSQPSSNGLCVQMITDSLSNATYKYQRGGWKTYGCGKTSASYICEKGASA